MHPPDATPTRPESRVLSLESRVLSLESRVFVLLLTLDSGLSTETHFRPVHDGQADHLRCLMHLDHAAEPVVIGDAERAVPELGGPLHEPQRMRSPVEEAVVGMGVELCVPCHALSVIERTFDRNVVGLQSSVSSQTPTRSAGGRERPESPGGH